MVKQPGRDSDDDVTAGHDADSVAAALEVYESKLAALLRTLEELTDSDKTTADQARAAEISAEIRRINREMNQLRERTGQSRGACPKERRSRETGAAQDTRQDRRHRRTPRPVTPAQKHP